MLKCKIGARLYHRRHQPLSRRPQLTFELRVIHFLHLTTPTITSLESLQRIANIMAFQLHFALKSFSKPHYTVYPARWQRP
jgi:hypothetical protein